MRRTIIVVAFYLYALPGNKTVYCIPSIIQRTGSRDHGSCRREHKKKKRAPPQPSPLPNEIFLQKQVFQYTPADIVIGSLRRPSRACSPAEQKYVVGRIYYVSTFLCSRTVRYDEQRCRDSCHALAVGTTCLGGGLGCPTGSNGPGVVTASTAR
jgi:hypothetical protein